MDRVTPAPYRFGFAVKVLGDGGLKPHDSRRWRKNPSLTRSIELLDAVFDYLAAIDVRVYRLSSSVIPYGTHPDLPQFDYRRQLAACAAGLTALGQKARRLGLRLSTHPGQYTVLNALDAEIARRARLDVEQDALLLDALGQGPDAVVVVHVGGAYGDRRAALDRWVRSYELLSDRARRRLVVEHDETLFSARDVLGLHGRTGVAVVYDHHHHRCNPDGLDAAAAFTAAYRTWPAGVRPKVHLSSARPELPGLRPARPSPHADFVTASDAAGLFTIAPGPVDVMLEAKAKDLALLWLRDQLRHLDADLAAAEEMRQTSDDDVPNEKPGEAVRGFRAPGRERTRALQRDRPRLVVSRPSTTPKST
jgi:UV DNA damage endonuclease